MREIFFGIAAAVLALAFLWTGLREQSVHRRTIYAYYRHVQHVQKGMPVCVDGIEVGSVASVTVRPELGERPVEIVLKLNTPYDLKIPGGSIAQISEPGILRPTIVDIDTRAAVGSPISEGGTIEGRESLDDQTAHALGVIVKAVVDQSQEAPQSVPSTKSGKIGK